MEKFVSFTETKTPQDLKNLGGCTMSSYSFNNLANLMMQDVMRHYPNQKPPIGYRVDDTGMHLIFE